MNILHELKSVLSVRKAMKEKKRRKKETVEESPIPKESVADQNSHVDHGTETNDSNEGSSCLPIFTEKSQDNDHGRIAVVTEECIEQVDGSHDQLMQLQLMARAAAASKRKQNEEIFELSDDENEKD